MFCAISNNAGGVRCCRVAVGLLFVSLFASVAYGQKPLVQQVTFVGERVDFAPAGGVVSGSLQRFGDSASLASPLTIVVQPLRGGVVLPGISVKFAAGATLASYTMTVPAAAPGSNSALVLEIVEASGVVASGIGRRVLWQQGAPAVTGATEIRAMVFSGAESPSRAVLYDAAAFAGNPPLVVGGIVALGGGAAGSVSRQPVPLQPKKEYGTGEWIPPLSPRALLIRGGSVWSTAQ